MKHLALLIFAAIAPHAASQHQQLMRNANHTGSAATLVRSDGHVEPYKVQELVDLGPGAGGGQMPVDLNSMWSPVDGGEGRACRGAHETDDAEKYKMTIFGDTVKSLEQCKHFCMQTPNCHGVEHSPIKKRCEVWVRPEGIMATAKDEGSSCIAFVPGLWSPADGGYNRQCRGSKIDDDRDEYYFAFHGKAVRSINQCKRKCAETFGCKGIEHNPEFQGGYCEVWTRLDGIQTTQAANGYTCMLYEQNPEEEKWPGRWQAVGGGVNRACRGKDPEDDLTSYFKRITGDLVSSINVCKRLCANSRGCKGIEHNPRGHCELWFRQGGIGSTKTMGGYACLEFIPGKWNEVDGGYDRACRGKHADDDKVEYKLLKFGDLMRSLDKCKEMCLAVGGCKGIEHDPDGVCTVWTEMVSTSVANKGTTCLKYELLPPISDESGGVSGAPGNPDQPVPHMIGPDDMNLASETGGQQGDQGAKQAKQAAGKTTAKKTAKTAKKKAAPKPKPAPEEPKEEGGASRQALGRLALLPGALLAGLAAAPA